MVDSAIQYAEGQDILGSSTSNIVDDGSFVVWLGQDILGSSTSNIVDDGSFVVWLGSLLRRPDIGRDVVEQRVVFSYQLFAAWQLKMASWDLQPLG